MYSTKQIIVTGCSFSTGMEMNDSSLMPFDTREQRDINILKWGKSNLELAGMNIFKMNEVAKAEWESRERLNSWPALLGKRNAIDVNNLSKIGASVGHSLLSFSMACSKDSIKDTIAIHQIPAMGRMEIRLNDSTRVSVQPTMMSENFGFNKYYYSDGIKRVKKIYKTRLQKSNYVEQHFQKIITRLHKISIKNNIKSYYIVDKQDYLPDCVKENILIDNFDNFKGKYPIGPMGHPVGAKYNEDLCDICESILY